MYYLFFSYMTGESAFQYGDVLPIYVNVYVCMCTYVYVCIPHSTTHLTEYLSINNIPSPQANTRRSQDDQSSPTSPTTPFYTLAAHQLPGGPYLNFVQKHACLFLSGHGLTLSMYISLKCNVCMHVYALPIVKIYRPVNGCAVNG